MIPKIIHYVWLGGNELPDSAKKNIETWKKFNPDYEIKQWNESNFDFSISKYAQEACDSKKWGFAADIVRLYALYNEGGIYMDTDVECVKSFDSLLDNHAVLCFENKYYLSNAVMMCEKHNPLFKYFIDCYDKRKFIVEDPYRWGCGLELISAPVYMTSDLMKYEKKHFIKNGHYKLDNITLVPQDYLSPNIWDNPDDHYKSVTENTVTIHHFDSSWKIKNPLMLTKLQYLYIRIRFFIAFKFTRLIGNVNFLKLEQSSYELTHRYNKKNKEANKKHLIEW